MGLNIVLVISNNIFRRLFIYFHCTRPTMRNDQTRINNILPIHFLPLSITYDQPCIRYANIYTIPN